MLLSVSSQILEEFDLCGMSTQCTFYSGTPIKGKPVEPGSVPLKKCPFNDLGFGFTQVKTALITCITILYKYFTSRGQEKSVPLYRLSKNDVKRDDICEYLPSHRRDTYSPTFTEP